MVQKYRCLRPKGQHRTYRFQTQGEDGRWSTIHGLDIDALNRLVKAKILNRADADARAEQILRALYEERNRHKPIATMLPGNARILDEFLATYYTRRKKRDMAPRSHHNEVLSLQRALLALGNLPIDGNLDSLQEQIDKKFERNPPIHKRRVTSINRLRKFLALPHILHMKSEQEPVVYRRREEIEELIGKLDDPYKTLVAVAFYTGMRKGELFAITRESIGEDVVNVTRQMYPQGKGGPRFGPPKHGKKHRAFILPGGKEWVDRWVALLESEEGVSRGLKVGPKIREHVQIRFHDLRHSYAVYLIAQGATLDWVAQSMGHTRETCERYYSGPILNDDAIKLMRSLFKAMKN